MSPESTTNAKAPLSVVIPALNEEHNLREALESVSWAAEVILVDSGSHDATVEIAESFGANVVQFSYIPGGPKKKAWSLRNLDFSYDWVLYLDGDERVTPALRDEIVQLLESPRCDGYYLDREFIFRGRQLTSYRPDWNLRLFRHAKAEIEDLGLADVAGTGDNEIHEHFLVDGTKGFLEATLLHRDYRGIGPWIERHNKYATWEAQLYRRLREEPLNLGAAGLRDPVERNRMLRRLWVRLPGRPLLRFLVWYFGKRAFRDGYNGAVYSGLMGWYELLVSLKLQELSREPVPAARTKS
jgi:glycosyltransferase involved in cell wall biosynthesis